MPLSIKENKDGGGRYTTSAFEIYCKEMSVTELLTPEEEKELAIVMSTAGPEAEKARDHFIRANLRLVIKIARDYEGRGVPMDDLVSEGNIGLMKAVDRFNYRYGNKLSTYAAWWIRRYMRVALGNQGRTIRIPIYMINKMFKLKAVEKGLEEVLKRPPNKEEILEEIGFSKVSLRGIEKARSIVPISLNKRLGPNSEASLEDRISDPNAEMASEAAERSYDSVEVLYALSCLNDRERSVIGDRFGLSKDSDPQTLEEIGVKLQVTRERVRQIEAMALFKMHRYMVKRNSLTEGKPLKNVTNGQYINSKPSVLKEHLVNKRNGENRHH